MAYSQEYIDLLDRMKQLHKDKNAGYAGDSIDPWSNFRECNSFNISTVDGVITRMCDKWARFRSLYRNPTNDKVSEPITDTLQDLASYALILSLLLQEGAYTEYTCATFSSYVVKE